MKYKEEISFYEKQKMPLLFLIPIGILLLFVVFSFISKNKINENVWPFVTVIIGCTSVAVLFYMMSLETIINETGVYIKMFPIQWKYKVYSWDSISEAYVRKYNPIMEYGGWGYRFGMNLVTNRKISVAYSLSGNMGLQLILTTGRRVLIATHKPEEITEILKELGKTD
ncbi:MAG: hypothetical protein LBR97_06870 [Dysgonamonadaceae bacterium]|jgi:hypothetical protein|nr:hypothetical protein [Dysgonamonadaceae bacterium]